MPGVSNDPMGNMRSNEGYPPRRKSLLNWELSSDMLGAGKEESKGVFH